MTGTTPPRLTAPRKCAGAGFSLRAVGGPGPGDSWNLWSNGSIETSLWFSETNELVVIARGSIAAGQWPQMRVHVDGQPLATVVVASSQWTVYRFPVSTTEGAHAVRISFLNDYFRNGEDRNLLLAEARVEPHASTDPHPLPTPSPAQPAPAPRLPPMRPTSPQPVARWGRLQVRGGQLLDQAGHPVQLCGMSSHGLQWYPAFANAQALRWLRDAWGATVFRAAVYTREGGIVDQPRGLDRVHSAIDAAIAEGMYIVVDWHILSDGDPTTHQAEAVAFFTHIARRYGRHPNILYEICNEPNGNITWEHHVLPYANTVIAAIRAIDPHNVILVGSPNWSQDIHIASQTPPRDANTMLTFHIYAGTHPLAWAARIREAQERGVGVFVSEWGATRSDGAGGIHEAAARAWVQAFDRAGVSWIGWNLSDKDEASAALRRGAPPEGGWTSRHLTPSGALMGELIRAARDRGTA